MSNFPVTEEVRGRLTVQIRKTRKKKTEPPVNNYKNHATNKLLHFSFNSLKEQTCRAHLSVETSPRWRFSSSMVRSLRKIKSDTAPRKRWV